MCLHEVDDPLVGVVKHADLDCMDEVGPREVAHNTRNMFNCGEILVDMA